MSHSSSDKLHSQSGSHTDAAPGTRAHNDKASTQQSQTSVQPVEPEDPRETGTSHSQNRALDLNAGRHQESRGAGKPGHQAEEHPESPAGQHATGSFTDKKRRNSA
ncbi:MAG: hypothetical protein WA399_02755 [Acidobacteriaceae bacterium]